MIESGGFVDVTTHASFCRGKLVSTNHIQGRTLRLPIQPCNRRPACRGYRLSSRRRGKNVCPRACRRRRRFRSSASRLSSRSPPGLHFGDSCCKPEGVPSQSQCCTSCGRRKTEGERRP